jgi:hypothetical protein
MEFLTKALMVSLAVILIGWFFMATPMGQEMLVSFMTFSREH